jgi:DNA-binding transcriptional regulator YdaS (Cro superfamily)
LNRFADAFALALLLGMSASPVLAWSCGSDDVLAADASPSERARISAEVARERALSAALACIEAGLEDCPEMPGLTSVAAPAE